MKLRETSGTEAELKMRETTKDNVQYNGKDRKLESSMEYSKKGEQAISSKTEYNDDGSIKSKNIETATAVKNKKARRKHSQRLWLHTLALDNRFHLFYYTIFRPVLQANGKFFLVFAVAAC